MPLAPRRWRLSHLLGAWAAYWAALAAVTLGPAVPVGRRVTALGEGRGTIAASFDNAILKLTMVADGATVWSATTTVGTALAWLVGPPLVLWVLWLVTRPAVADATVPRDDPRALGGGAMPDVPVRERRGEELRRER